MKSTVLPQVNDAELTNKINSVLKGNISPEKIFTDTPPIIGSEDFNHLVSGNNRIVRDYVIVGPPTRKPTQKPCKKENEDPILITTAIIKLT